MLRLWVSNQSLVINLTDVDNDDNIKIVARCSIVVKALHYRLQSHGSDT